LLKYVNMLLLYYSIIYHRFLNYINYILLHKILYEKLYVYTLIYSRVHSKKILQNKNLATDIRRKIFYRKMYDVYINNSHKI